MIEIIFAFIGATVSGAVLGFIFVCILYTLVVLAVRLLWIWSPLRFKQWVLRNKRPKPYPSGLYWIVYTRGFDCGTYKLDAETGEFSEYRHAPRLRWRDVIPW